MPYTRLTLSACGFREAHAERRRDLTFFTETRPVSIEHTEAGASPPAHHQIEQVRTPVLLGEGTRVEIVAHETHVPGLTYASTHDDENTAVAATLGTLRRRGGRLVEVRHTGERNVSFEHRGETYAFDPNRVFTTAGAEATLRDLGAFSEDALEIACGFAEQFLDVIDADAVRAQAGPLVAVHNNKPGFYSAKSYGRGGEHERDAQRMRPKRETTPDDFFFVIREEHYRLLQGGPFHVVLQDNASVTDDGSLSVWAFREGVAYVNVEAQHGHLREQIDMLTYLHARLAS